MTIEDTKRVQAALILKKGALVQSSSCPWLTGTLIHINPDRAIVHWSVFPVPTDGVKWELCDIKAL